MIDNYEKYLPIGSVVLLKNAKKRIMITGLGIRTRDGESSKIWDYVGCLYPEGFISSDKNLVFNHDQISQVFALGYFDEEAEKHYQEVVTKLLVMESESTSTDDVEVLDLPKFNEE